MLRMSGRVGVACSPSCLELVLQTTRAHHASPSHAAPLRDFCCRPAGRVRLEGGKLSVGRDRALGGFWAPRLGVTRKTFLARHLEEARPGGARRRRRRRGSGLMLGEGALSAPLESHPLGLCVGRGTGHNWHMAWAVKLYAHDGSGLQPGFTLLGRPDSGDLSVSSLIQMSFTRFLSWCCCAQWVVKGYYCPVFLTQGGPTGAAGGQGVWHCRLRCFRWGYLLRGRVKIDLYFLLETALFTRASHGDGVAFWLFAGDCNARGMGLKLLVQRPVPPLAGWPHSRSSDVESRQGQPGGGHAGRDAQVQHVKRWAVAESVLEPGSDMATWLITWHGGV